jgi:hypothetical protein
MRQAQGVVSFAGVVWSQAGGVEVEMGTEAPLAFSPPFAPRGAHYGLDARASEECNGVNAESCSDKTMSQQDLNS